MKKIVALLLVIIALFSFASCGNSIPKEGNRYVYMESEEVVKPSITLLRNNKCEFTFDSMCTYLGTSTYTIEGDKLVIKTDDGQFTYTFTVDSDMKKLVFDAKNSSEDLLMGDFEDGAVFELFVDPTAN